MTYKYIFTEKAELELDKIIDYLKNNLCNEEAAKKFFLELSEKLELICDFPKTSPVIKNRFIDFLEIRKFAIKRYLVNYYIDEEEKNIIILALRHSLEDQETILNNI